MSKKHYWEYPETAWFAKMGTVHQRSLKRGLIFTKFDPVLNKTIFWIHIRRFSKNPSPEKRTVIISHDQCP